MIWLINGNSLSGFLSGFKCILSPYFYMYYSNLHTNNLVSDQLCMWMSLIQAPVALLLLVISRQEESGFPVDPVLERPKTTSSLHTYLLRRENTKWMVLDVDFRFCLQMNGKMCKYPSIKLYLPQMNVKTSKYMIQSMDKIKLNVGWEHSNTTLEIFLQSFLELTLNP